MKQVGAVFIVRDDHLRQTISGRENQGRGVESAWANSDSKPPSRRKHSFRFELYYLMVTFALNEPALRQFASVENKVYHE